jgi:ribosomal protein S18 acetylase RimI-like enzyme
MARTYPRNVPIEIRPASAADEPTIGEIRHETWLTAYAQIIDPAIIGRVTAPGGRANAALRSDRTSLVAVAPPGQAQAAADARVIVGYASYGPERSIASAASVGSGAQPGSLTPAGLAGETGELYTLYVSPAHWSTGAGRALTDAALDGLRAAGYQRVVLWTLTENARARRFYDKAGFAPDGATNILDNLGSVEELRYVRDL